MREVARVVVKFLSYSLPCRCSGALALSVLEVARSTIRLEINTIPTQLLRVRPTSRGVHRRIVVLLSSLAGFAGPMDPQFTSYLVARASTFPTRRKTTAAPMFGVIDSFYA